MIHETWKNIKQHQDYKLRRLYLERITKYREIVGVYQMRCDFRTIETPLCSIQRVWERVWREKNESWLDFFLFPCWPLLHSDLSIWLTVLLLMTQNRNLTLKTNATTLKHGDEVTLWQQIYNYYYLLFFAFVIKRALIQFFLCDIAGFTNGRKVQKTISDTEGTGNCIIDQGMETIGQCRQGYHPIFQNLHCVSHFFI